MVNALLFLRANWKLALAGLLLALCAVQSVRLSITQTRLSAEREGRKADRAEYARAQMEATAKALAEKQRKEAEYARKAEVADSAYAALGDQYRTAVLRYQAAQRAGSGSDLSGPAETAQGPDRPGGGAVIPQGSILIPTDDALVCATNTARLEAARAWALDLEKNQ
jgi:hypothetical protein